MSNGNRNHHIYIHYKGDGANPPKRTTPNIGKNSKTSVDSLSDLKGVKTKIERVVSTIKNPTSAAVGQLSKAIPIVGAIVAAIGVVDSLVETGVDIYGSYTGDTNSSYPFKNFKNAFSKVLDPLSAGLGYWKTELNYRASYLQASQSKFLTANSINNIKTNIGGRKV